MVGKARKPHCPGALHRLTCIWSNVASLLSFNCHFPFILRAEPFILMTAWMVLLNQSLWGLTGPGMISQNELSYRAAKSRSVYIWYYLSKLLPCWLSGEESACCAGDPGSILRLGGFLGEGNGNPLQYSCLENPMGRGAWRATVHGVAKELDTT